MQYFIIFLTIYRRLNYFHVNIMNRLNNYVFIPQMTPSLTATAQHSTLLTGNLL